MTVTLASSVDVDAPGSLVQRRMWRREAEGAEVMVTPEAVPLDLPVAGVGTRALARLIDLFVLQSVGTVLLFVVGLVGAALPSWIAMWLGFGLVLVLTVGYPVLFETRFRGRTIGKMAMGLRVVAANGGPVGLRACLVRAVVGLFEVYAVLGTVAFFSAFVTNLSQRLGDMAAGTYVLNERAADSSSVPVVFPPPQGYEDFVRTVDVSRVTPHQYAAIRAFLLRSNSLSATERFRLGSRLGDELLQRLQLRSPDQMNPETFLVCVCAAYQRRDGGLGAVGWERYETSVYVPPVPVGLTAAGQ